MIDLCAGRGGDLGGQTEGGRRGRTEGRTDGGTNGGTGPRKELDLCVLDRRMALLPDMQCVTAWLDLQGYLLA
jgi:hypothetical protein